MTIIKKMYNIPAGTIVCRQTGDIEITSEYDSFHGWYSYKDIDDENNEGYVTPADLIGDHIF